MADDTGSGGYDRAIEELDLARGAVKAAGAKVADVRRHFGDAVERARQPETYGELLKNSPGRLRSRCLERAPSLAGGAGARPDHPINGHSF
jgi:hypothetical protein